LKEELETQLKRARKRYEFICFEMDELKTELADLDYEKAEREEEIEQIKKELQEINEEEEENKTKGIQVHFEKALLDKKQKKLHDWVKW